jgi:hypothetical protein
MMDQIYLVQKLKFKFVKFYLRTKINFVNSWGTKLIRATNPEEDAKLMTKKTGPIDHVQRDPTYQQRHKLYKETPR